MLQLFLKTLQANLHEIQQTLQTVPKQDAIEK